MVNMRDSSVSEKLNVKKLTNILTDLLKGRF